ARSWVLSPHSARAAARKVERSASTRRSGAEADSDRSEHRLDRLLVAAFAADRVAKLVEIEAGAAGAGPAGLPHRALERVSEAHHRLHAISRRQAPNAFDALADIAAALRTRQRAETHEPLAQLRPNHHHRVMLAAHRACPAALSQARMRPYGYRMVKAGKP